jgi:hypothetical protein
MSAESLSDVQSRYRQYPRGKGKKHQLALILWIWMEFDFIKAERYKRVFMHRVRLGMK